MSDRIGRYECSYCEEESEFENVYVYDCGYVRPNSLLCNSCLSSVSPQEYMEKFYGKMPKQYNEVLSIGSTINIVEEHNNYVTKYVVVGYVTNTNADVVLVCNRPNAEFAPLLVSDNKVIKGGFVVVDVFQPDNRYKLSELHTLIKQI